MPTATYAARFQKRLWRQPSLGSALLPLRQRQVLLQLGEQEASLLRRVGSRRHLELLRFCLTHFLRTVICCNKFY